jgi:putative ABC transport system permease protein
MNDWRFPRVTITDMRWLRKLGLRIRSLLVRRGVERELSDEIRFHFEKLAEQKVALGMALEDARWAASRELGGMELIKEECRDMRKVNFIENLVRDVRYGLRALRRNPGFAAVTILTLSLGVGATTAMFSVVDAVVLKPLPFPTADRLVRVASVILANGAGGIASYPDFVDWRSENHVFEGLAAFRTGDFTLTGRSEPLHLQGGIVSATLFSLLGVTPALGRTFLPQEDNPAAANGADPVILGHALWRREFGSDDSVIGRTVQLSGQPFTVVGVMPEGFQYPIQAEPIDLWTTIAFDAHGGMNAMTAQRGAHYLDVVGLLKPGVTDQQAQAEMVTIASALNKRYPENKARTVRIMPELQRLAGPLRTPMLVLLGAVGCVLLIVCANIANLLLARASGRHREMAVRAALGATRRRAVCQLLTETVTLGLLGGGLGLMLGLASLRFLVRLIPVGLPRLNAIGLDGRLLGFALVVSLLVGILFGLAPALRVSRIELTDSLKESGRGSGAEGRGNHRLREVLVVSEIALAVVLLVGAGLLTKSFLRLTQVDPGFDPHQVLTFQLDSPAGKQPGELPEFYREVVERMRALPGVSSASAVFSLPLTGDNVRSSIEIEGQPTPIGSRPSADFNVVEPDYFRAIGVPMLAGRDFTDHDDSQSVPVVIVNRRLAQLFFPNQNPIGKHVRPGIGNGYTPGQPPMREIVGVIGDVKQSELGAEAAPEVYAPLAQSPFEPMIVVTRTTVDPRTIVGPARREVASLDKQLPLYNALTLDQYFADAVSEPRFSTILLAGFAALALLLACLGVYGVISYVVAQRTHEIGIRLALGAESAGVLRWVLARGLLLAGTGVALGLAVSLGLSHLLSSLLYGVRATDPVTFAGASLSLLVVAVLASYIPARRAARVDPMVALRYE